MCLTSRSNEKNDLDKLVDIIASLEPTFGGINLEDIKAPDCFYVERKLRERMKIPVFHDDQHGTAICVGAAILNGHQNGRQRHQDGQARDLGRGRRSGWPASDCWSKLGMPRENIFVTDLAGVVYEGRTELMDADKIIYSQKTSARTLGDVIEGADVFPRACPRAACSRKTWLPGWHRTARHHGAGQPQPRNLAGRRQGSAQ